MSIILSIVGNFLSNAQKHNRQKLEHDKPGPTSLWHRYLPISHAHSYILTHVSIYVYA